jgi:hypothetical protein
MIRHVFLERLPDGLRFPGDLDRKMDYDPQRRRLSFDGFMSKATFDRLYRLAEDRDYRHALEELFQQCTFDEPDSAGGHRLRRIMAAVFGSG